MEKNSEDQCPDCGHRLVVGDYPFCSNGSGHSTIYSRNAQVAEATVVFRNKKGEYRFPGRTTDKPPRGFERVELRNPRERDRFEKEFRAKEDQKSRDVAYDEHQAWKNTFAAHKDRLLAIRDQSSSEYTKRFIDRCLVDAEKRMSRRPDRAESGFHIESNHYDASNRMPWVDKDTGWRPRR